MSETFTVPVVDSKYLVGPGGANVHGFQADGTPTSRFVPEGTLISQVGTLRKDDDGNVNGVYCSDGAWHSGDTTGLLRDDMTIVPITPVE